MTKKWIRTKPRRARPTATLLQRTRSPTTPSTCGTRTTWSSLCPTTRTPRSARCWWLPSPTSPLSSRTARRVTTPWTSPAARPQPKGSTSRGRCDFWCKGIATANSLDDQGAPECWKPQRARDACRCDFEVSDVAAVVQCVETPWHVSLLYQPMYSTKLPAAITLCPSVLCIDDDFSDLCNLT